MTTSLKSQPQNVARRTFLGWALGVSLLGLLGQAGTALFQFFKPRIEPGTFGGKVVAGQVGEFQPGTVSHVSKGRFYISRLEDGGLLALWQRCTHLGCTVPWREDEGQFHCPCHSSLFTRTGEVVGGPAPRPLDMFAIEIEDGQVVVDTGNPITRDSYDPSQATRV
jgi:cytochrome b6-f complex iron-sulfur subunit